MWVMTTYGFFSVVQHNEKVDGKPGLTIRARDRRSLELLSQRLPGLGPIDENPDRDYVYRAVATREAIGVWLAAEVAGIQYPNFKDEVVKTGGQRGKRLAKFFGEIWHVLASFGAGAYGQNLPSRHKPLSKTERTWYDGLMGLRPVDDCLGGRR